MRLVALTPAHVGAPEIARRQARYDDFGDEQVSVIVHDQPDQPEVPHSFDTAELVESAERCMLTRAADMQLAPEDVILPDCILDTALEEVLDLGLPAHGILKLTVGMIKGLGLRYGAVARNHAVGNALDARIRDYDAGPAFVGTAVLDLPTEAVSDAKTWNGALSAHVARLAERGAQVVINGCSAVDVAEGPWAVPVVDPTQLAVRSIALAAELGIVGGASARATVGARPGGLQ